MVGTLDCEVELDLVLPPAALAWRTCRRGYVFSKQNFWGLLCFAIRVRFSSRGAFFSTSDVELKTKNITVDRRLDCSKPISFVFYDSDNPLESSQEAICAFCAIPLKASSISELENLIKNPKMRVIPSCESGSCLSLNPKANYKNGWTVKEKQTRKRRAQGPERQAPPKKKRPVARKPKKRKRNSKPQPKKKKRPPSS